jgi:predicted regulator of Ras-like GTPase activity (Roadblock/LC7/MglB family)
MNGKTRWIALGIVLAVLASLAVVTVRASSLAQEPQPPDIVGALGGPGTPLGTGFTYQGKLDEDGVPRTGTCDFQFSLWDAAEGGNQIGTTQTETGVALSEGLFTVDLDFGSTAFWGNARWLQIAVRCPTGSGSYTTLDPRQALTAAPYALYASKAPWSGLTGVPAGFADGVDDNTTYNRAAPAANDITTVDDTGTVGSHTSITIGADGLPLISYYDSTNYDLKVLHCGNAACSAGNTVTTLDSAGHVGKYTSIAIGADGLGLISYYDDTNDDLKVAHCSNTTCTAATRTTLDSAGNVGWYTSITIGADGLPVVSYLAATIDDLKVARCSNTACTAATRTTLDSVNNVGYFTSITIGTDGLPVVSYLDTTNNDLKVAHCSNAFCVPYFRRR